MEKAKGKNAGYLNLLKEQMIKLPRQTWTMYHNLKDWFAWLCNGGGLTPLFLYFFFIVKCASWRKDWVQHPSKKAHFQLRWNAFFAWYGGRGGKHQQATLSLVFVILAQLQTKCACIIFSSATQDETNYSMSAEWMFDLLRKYAQFGHDSPQSLCSTVTVNSKGGTDSLVLHPVLTSYVKCLYLDAWDEVGCQVLVKIDGGLVDFVWILLLSSGPGVCICSLVSLFCPPADPYAKY
jgi:hypothetical protein